MIVAKVYKYDSTQEENGYKGEDFSKYAVLGYSSIDNLEDTLDTFSISLVGLPFRKEFAPKTKFIIELYDETIDPDTGEKSLTLWNEPFHLVVDSDVVEQPIISDDTYFTHNLSLIEPSVDTQSRLVDNISVTYKLQDVTLEEQPTYDIALEAVLKLTDTPSTTTEFKREYETFWNATKKYMIQGHKFEWVLPYWYNVTIDGVTTTPENWWKTNSIKFYQDVDIAQTSKRVSFPVPMLRCSSAMPDSKNYIPNGYCSIDCVITDKELSTGKQTQRTIRINPYSGGADPETQWHRDYFDRSSGLNSAGLLAPTSYGWIVSRWETKYYSGDGSFCAYLSKVAEPSSTRDNRVISIDVEPNHSYNISFSLHNFNLTSKSGSGMEDRFSTLRSPNSYIDNIPAYYSYARTYWSWSWKYDNNANYVNYSFPNASISFQGVKSAGEGKIVFASAPPASAYDLFNKAQLCTQTFLKDKDVIVDETNKQVELREEDAQLLRDTTIIENFYNQKNLWEILLDIGKYIHARPKLRFGTNGKYVVTWKKYGDTKQKTDNGNAISIYNSRFVEDYIGAVSSYVANMVQLGGVITETLVAKSSSEDFLVYNDVAEIKTSKNIIEILSLEVAGGFTTSPTFFPVRELTGKDPNIQLVQVRSDGQVTPIGKQNTTGFVFEEGVYKLLDVSPTTSINKGFAIYYKLGTNVIKGLNYRLPTANTGDPINDYAIKNILGCAYNLTNYADWKNIKVNDFVFRITYRTKDTLRTDQSRPDLRKYLLTTPYDNVPQHHQFANQTDTVVDSVKYGNNIYGKLIRTGNETYTKREWVENLASLKKSGELYIINGEWFYVSKCTNTYFTDHIISEVEFSKDFNKLSQIIGIPSEPRFYEISEQSLIEREVAINDYVVMGTKPINRTNEDKTFLKDGAGKYIGDLLFSPKNDTTSTSEEEIEKEYPKYIVTTFKNDLNKVVQQNTEPLDIPIISPASTYSLENTLTIEWDMLDNFSAGDKVIEADGYINSENRVNTAYNLLKAVRYCDKYGRADMFNFAILENAYFNAEQIQAFPESSVDLSQQGNNLLFGDQDTSFYSANNTDKNKGVVLLKDNREKLSFNYNLQMLTDSDRFVLSAYLWQQGKTRIKLALLNEEVNKISNATIEDRVFLQGDIPFKFSAEGDVIKVNIAEALQNAGITDEELANASAIAIYSDVFINDSALSSSKYFIAARNITGLSVEEMKQDWYISPYSKSMFPKQ